MRVNELAEFTEFFVEKVGNGDAGIAGEGVGEIEEGVRRESMRDLVSGGCRKVCDGVGGESGKRLGGMALGSQGWGKSWKRVRRGEENGGVRQRTVEDSGGEAGGKMTRDEDGGGDDGGTAVRRRRQRQPEAAAAVAA